MGLSAGPPFMPSAFSILCPALANSHLQAGRFFDIM
jgi:hypothetical protein